MKGNKLEPLYLILSIVLLTITGFFYLSSSKKEVAAQPVISRTSTSSSEKTADKEEKIADLNKRLVEIAKNPNKDLVTAIKKEIQALEKGSDKTKLLKTLADVERDLATIASIEANLGLAQNSGELAYLQTAQTAIDSLKAEIKKAELQTRLNDIAAILASQTVESDSEVSPEEEAELTVETIEEVYTPIYQGYQTGGYTSEIPNETIPSPQETVVTPPVTEITDDFNTEVTPQTSEGTETSVE